VSENPGYKYSYALLWFIGLLLIFLIITDVLIVSNQRKELLEHADKYFADELNGIATAVKEPLLRHQYGEVEQFILLWGKEHNEIIEITAVMPNGFELAKYRSTTPPVNPTSHEKQVKYAGIDLVNLQIVHDFSEEEKIIAGLQAQLISGSVLMIIIFGSVLWVTFQRTAVKPLEQEIAARVRTEEMLKEAKDQLETRVLERTEELRNANRTLQIEVDERKKTEAELKGSHERLITVLDSLSAIVYVADMTTYELLFINKYTQNIFGDITGKNCWKTLQSGQTGPCSFCTNDKLLKPDGQPAGVYNWEFKNTVNNRWYYMQDRAIPWTDGSMVRMEIATDITDRKTAEEKTLASLREKEVLLREVHHRTKNNMQVINSLLNLQSKQIPDRKYHEMFRDSQNRIKSMSLIHEKLYRSADLGHIDFNDYIKSLAKNLFNTYGTPRLRVSLKTDIENVTLDIDAAIPCGLIINELISNSLKHAFPSDREGEIRISFTQTPLDGTNEYILTINDNGIGIPDNIDIKQSKSLGLQLVTSLAEHQLQGTIDLDRDKGTKFSIRFMQPVQKAEL
jgi:two-component sensor histidine kinase